MSNIEASIKNMGSEQIIAVAPNKSTPFVITIVGLVLFIVGIVGVIGVAAVNTTLIVVGVVLLVYGSVKIIKAFSSDYSHFVYEPTGGKLKKYTLFFQPEERERLHSILKDGNFKTLARIKKEMNAKEMLEVMATDDAAILLAQTSEYVPHYYAPVSDLFVYKDGKAKELLEYCRK